MTEACVADLGLLVGTGAAELFELDTSSVVGGFVELGPVLRLRGENRIARTLGQG